MLSLTILNLTSGREHALQRATRTSIASLVLVVRAADSAHLASSVHSDASTRTRMRCLFIRGNRVIKLLNLSILIYSLVLPSTEETFGSVALGDLGAASNRLFVRLEA